MSTKFTSQDLKLTKNTPSPPPALADAVVVAALLDHGGGWLAGSRFLEEESEKQKYIINYKKNTKIRIRRKNNKNNPTI